ncbi:MAG TPA: glycoside hydrolase family 25 protein [Anaerolineae bacterium]|nr:glycoside hydrolase family 25 protein [Anaerolineae bacterium]
MNRLLGPNVTWLAGGLPELLLTWRPPVVVTSIPDPVWSRLKRTSPGTQLVFAAGQGMPDLADGRDLALVADEQVGRALAAAGSTPFDYLQITSKPPIPDREALARFAEFEVEAMRAAAARGHKLAIGTFATASPKSLGWWDAYYPALRAGRGHGACLLLHEYNYPSLQTRDAIWYNLRHRAIYPRLPAEMQLPLIIGECGLSGQARRRDGTWRDRLSPDEYLRQLELYDAELQRDSYVLGAAVFCAGQAGEWAGFDIFPEPATALGHSADPLYRGETAPQYDLGCDVSWWQGTQVDWAVVARSGISFVILRASRGNGPDAIYLRNCRDMDASLRCGAYHYVTAKDHPAEQVQVCVRQIRQFPLPMWADLEDNGLTDQACRAFVDGLEQALGARVGIYTSRHKATQIQLGAWAANHPLWVADWRGKEEPLIPVPWEEAGKTYAYWQFTVADSWPGFPGRLDLNRKVNRP